MLKIGEIQGGDIEVFLEQVPYTDKTPPYFRYGIGCQVRIVKGSNTPFTIQDAAAQRFCFGDILDVFHNTNKKEIGKFFCPGFEEYRFQGDGFGSNDQGQFVLAFIIRPVHPTF